MIVSLVYQNYEGIPNVKKTRTGSLISFNFFLLKILEKRKGATPVGIARAEDPSRLFPRLAEALPAESVPLQRIQAWLYQRYHDLGGFDLKSFKSNSVSLNIFEKCYYEIHSPIKHKQ